MGPAARPSPHPSPSGKVEVDDDPMIGLQPFAAEPWSEEQARDPLVAHHARLADPGRSIRLPGSREFLYLRVGQVKCGSLHHLQQFEDHLAIEGQADQDLLQSGPGHGRLVDQPQGRNPGIDNTHDRASRGREKSCSRRQEENC